MKLILLALFVALNVFAGDVPPVPPNPTLIPANAFPNVSKVLPGFPKKGSLAETRDFDQLKSWTDSKTEDECKRAASEAKKYNLKVFFGLPNSSLTEEQIKSLEPLFDEVQGDVTYFTYFQKNYWKRTRPLIARPELRPCDETARKDTSPSYPSGHTVLAEVFTRLLTQIYPAQKHAFEARAQEIEDDRILAAYHYPSDIEAGKKFGDKLFNLLKKNKEFETQIKELRKAAQAN